MIQLAPKDVFAAIRRHETERVKELLASDPELLGRTDATGITPLLAALYAGARDIVELIVETRHTAEAAAGLDDGWTVFEAAALGDRGRLSQLLEADPAIVNTRSGDGWTPLHLAAFFGRRQTVELLLRHGADLHARSENEMSNTPLHAATAGRHADVADLLLAHGADVRAVAAGWAPLHIAAGNGAREVAEVLLAAGADVNARGGAGQTPLAIASERGHRAVAELFRESGGRE